MTRKAVVPEVIEVLPPARQSSTPSLATQMRLKAVQNRLATIEAIGNAGGEAIGRINVRAGQRIERGIRAMEGFDTPIERVGSDVAEAWDTLKKNMVMHQIQLAHETSTETHEATGDAIAWVRSMATADFYTPTTWERLRALWQNTYAELLLRPGAPRLTSKQELKELFVGGEVSRISNEYDQAEMRHLHQAAAPPAVPADAEQYEQLSAGQPNEEVMTQFLAQLLAKQQETEPQEVQ